MSSSNRDQFIGRTLDSRYRVRAKIARGGMGTVYLGEDLRLSRKVAIKAMHPHMVDDEALVRRFEKEAHAAARLNNPNVVNVHDQGFDGEIPYLVMEYVPGITLRDLLKRQKRLTADQALEISEAVLSGLAAAHQAGFIHRDVKPENIFLANDGRIKVGDFGLARAANTNTTTGQALLGTIAYLSPELITRGVADARSDVYAFGIMLYEMLTGTQPFRGEQAVQVAYMHANQDVPKPSLISRESTPELDELVRWTTLRDPERRPRDAAVVLARLRQLLNGGLEAGTKVISDTAAAPTSIIAGTTKVLDQNTTVQQGSPTQTPPPQAPSQPPAAAGAGGVAGANGIAGAGVATGAASQRSQQAAQRADAAKQRLSPIEVSQLGAEKRAKRGKIITLVIIALATIVAIVAWWFGQGPGNPHKQLPIVSQPTAAAPAAPATTAPAFSGAVAQLPAASA